MLAIASKKEKQERYISYLKERYVRYLLSERERCFSAKRLGLKECQRCGYCCIFLTCVPRPNEMEPIAKFLGLTAIELARKYMVVDKYVNTHYFLSFAKEGQKDVTGTYIPQERMLDQGHCIFFDKENKGCKIHQVRPEEAKDWSCWEDSPDDAYSTGASHWRRFDICKFVPEFRPGPRTIILNKNV